MSRPESGPRGLALCRIRAGDDETSALRQKTSRGGKSDAGSPTDDETALVAKAHEVPPAKPQAASVGPASRAGPPVRLGSADLHDPQAAVSPGARKEARRAWRTARRSTPVAPRRSCSPA